MWPFVVPVAAVADALVSVVRLADVSGQPIKLLPYPKPLTKSWAYQPVVAVVVDDYLLALSFDVHRVDMPGVVVNFR